MGWWTGATATGLGHGRAAPLCAQLGRAVARSQAHGRVATPKGSRLLRGLLEELGEQLVLVYTPDPRLRRQPHRVAVAGQAPQRHHTHRRQILVELVADADDWARTITPAQVLSQIGSPFALDQQPPVEDELSHAA